MWRMGIEKRFREGVKVEDIAVLYRIHTDARSVVEGLLEKKIPFQMREHMANLYDHFIAKDLQAYFRMADGEFSRSDFLQIMRTAETVYQPRKRIGKPEDFV